MFDGTFLDGGGGGAHIYFPTVCRSIPSGHRNGLVPLGQAGLPWPSPPPPSPPSIMKPQTFLHRLHPCPAQPPPAPQSDLTLLVSYTYKPSTASPCSQNKVSVLLRCPALPASVAPPHLWKPWPGPIPHCSLLTPVPSPHSQPGCLFFIL